MAIEETPIKGLRSDDDLESSEEFEEEEAEEEEYTPNPNPSQNPSQNGETGLQQYKKPLAVTADDSRRLFQRLFSDDDEITILQGLLEYNSNRSGPPFFDRIKDRLQLDFNKNQLVEKIRRLKKKYRTITTKKEYSFKSPHEQVTFELSKRVWGGNVFARDDEEEDEPVTVTPAPERRRGRKRAVPEMVTEAVKGFVMSPGLKEMLYSAVGGPIGQIQPVPTGNAGMDEKWRRQQILELEVYSKRIELVHEQVRVLLEELRKG